MQGHIREAMLAEAPRGWEGWGGSKAPEVSRLPEAQSGEGAKVVRSEKGPWVWDSKAVKGFLRSQSPQGVRGSKASQWGSKDAEVSQCFLQPQRPQGVQEVRADVASRSKAPESEAPRLLKPPKVAKGFMKSQRPQEDPGGTGEWEPWVWGSNAAKGSEGLLRPQRPQGVQRWGGKVARRSKTPESEAPRGPREWGWGGVRPLRLQGCQRLPKLPEAPESQRGPWVRDPWESEVPRLLKASKASWGSRAPKGYIILGVSPKTFVGVRD